MSKKKKHIKQEELEHVTGGSGPQQSQHSTCTSGPPDGGPRKPMEGTSSLQDGGKEIAGLERFPHPQSTSPHPIIPEVL
jgi:hypothetical protein